MITTAYPTVELTDERMLLWAQMLKDMPFLRAQMNLREHILSSRFPPTIADIVRQDMVQSINYEMQRQETIAMFDEMKRWEEQAVPLPERLRPKMLQQGRDGD